MILIFINFEAKNDRIRHFKVIRAFSNRNVKLQLFPFYIITSKVYFAPYAFIVFVLFYSNGTEIKETLIRNACYLMMPTLIHLHIWLVIERKGKKHLYYYAL
jgi:hypothetical protein